MDVVNKEKKRKTEKKEEDTKQTFGGQLPQQMIPQSTLT